MKEMPDDFYNGIPPKKPEPKPQEQKAWDFFQRQLEPMRK